MAKKRTKKTTRSQPEGLSSQAMRLGRDRKNSERITPKEATLAAWRYYEQLVGDSPLTLEEVELSDDGTRWQITLGVTAKTKLPKLGSGFFTPEQPNQYKRFEVDAYSGDVLAMRIRKV